MAHIKRVSVSTAAVEDKALDPLGAAFLQVWAFVFLWILQGAFGSKNQ